MLYAILSDVHANADAFRRAVADARAKGAERLVCLGDVVGYGPDPQEAVNLVRSTCSDVVAGNHDDAVSGRIDPKDFSELARQAVVRHRAALSGDGLNWLRSLPRVLTGEGFVAAHGDLTEPERFLYVQDETDAASNFQARDFQLAFVGHTHTPRMFLTGSSGTVYKMPPTDFALEDGKRYIVNPGSVGFPRETDGTCLSSYALYDSERREVTFHALPFEVSSVMQHDRPKSARRRLLLAAAGAGLAALVGAACLLAATRPKPPRQEQTPAPQTDSQVFRSKEIDVAPGMRRLLPNLKLDKASAPVILRASFFDRHSHALYDKMLEVKRSRTQSYKLPKGTVKAKLELLRKNAADEPLLIDFSPTITP